MVNDVHPDIIYTYITITQLIPNAHVMIRVTQHSRLSTPTDMFYNAYWTIGVIGLRARVLNRSIKASLLSLLYLYVIRVVYNKRNDALALFVLVPHSRQLC